jgi:hypothetical protein
LAGGKVLLTLSKKCQKTQQRVVHPQAQEYMVVIPTKYNNGYGWADCVDGFIWVVKQMMKRHIIPIGAIVEPAD